MNLQLTIGQVAQEVGIPAKTIRYYEEIRLIQPANRLENNYREYSKEDISRLRLIKQARTLGLPLAEIKQLVAECFDGTCEHLKARFLTRLPRYRESVRGRIAELQEVQEQLERLEKNLATIKLSHPQMKVIQKDCCEVLEQIEKIIKKGGGQSEKKFRT